MLITDKHLADWYNNGDSFNIISFDLRKAFDRVQHDIVVQRLNDMGFHQSAVAWIENFLSNREQFVTFGTARSPMISVTSGVIAGSCLSPTLFNIFIDSLVTGLNAIVVMFADDFKVLLNTTKMDKKLAQSEVNKIFAWCLDNKMELSADKCACMHSSCDNNFIYKCGTADIPNVTSFKDLGIIRSRDGGYQEHPFYAVTKARRMICSITNNLSIPTAPLGWRLFKTYINPVLNYGTLAWNPLCRRDVITLERVQRQFSKWLPGMKSVQYKDRLERLDALSAEQTRFYSDMIFTFKLVHGLLSFSPSDFGLTTSSNITRGIRFVHEKLKRKSAQHFFRYRIPIEWDALPENVRSATTLSTFKTWLINWIRLNV